MPHISMQLFSCRSVTEGKLSVCLCRLLLLICFWAHLFFQSQRIKAWRTSLHRLHHNMG